MTSTVGVLHPGEMGAAVAGALVRMGHTVLWASEGRSAATRERAGQERLSDAGTLSALLERSDVVLAVCPPHGAVALAEQVAGFGGTYVDANAVSPQTAREIAAIVARGGASAVDGGVVGPPPREPGTTRLYLSGEHAPAVAALFADGPLAAEVLDGDPVAASALKMAYAAWTKGSGALVLAIVEAARRLGVEDALRAEWARSQPGLEDRAAAARAAAEAKGWRWVGEMEEIAATLAAAGLPDGFHRAAAEVYSDSAYTRASA